MMMMDIESFQIDNDCSMDKRQKVFFFFFRKVCCERKSEKCD